jgi:FKBP-type peptidyl-prolyl cis-trans isomerase FklB
MKSRLIIFLSILFLVFQAQAFAAQSSTDALSYSMGYKIGSAFKKMNFHMQASSFILGVKAGFHKLEPLISKEKMQQVLDKFQKKSVKLQKKYLATAADKNLKAGNDFLAANKKKSGVETLSNGLQYKVVTAGSGNKPKADDTVTVDYEGKLINGDVFDSSYKRGQPAQFKVSQVIPGWTQALQMMQKGSTWELFIPAKLSYGEKGIGPIGPNEVLIFKVHLIKIGK